MSTRLIKYEDVDFNEWDKLVETFENRSFEYSSDCIRYRMLHSQYILKNESYIYINNGNPEAVVLIFIEQVKGQVQISASNGELTSPLIATGLPYQYKEKLLKALMREVQSIRDMHGCKVVKYKFDPLVNPKNYDTIYNYNNLMKHGFVDNSINTQIIDLTVNEDILWREVRKGHKHLINKGKSLYKVLVYDRDTITLEIFEIYKNMHHEAAGRKTRSDESFYIMYEWILNGNALLFLTKYNEEFINSSIISTYSGTAYYASYAEKKTIEFPYPPGHYSQWRIINELKSRGVSYYEIGWQFFRNSKDVSTKDISISLFKRGFGGYTVSLFRGYYLV